MKRRLRWLLPVLVVAGVALVRSEVLGLGEAILVLVVVEVLLLLTGGTLLLSAVREYQKNRASGFDGWKALENGIVILLPRLAARIMVSELRLFCCLIKWTFRRTRLREGEFSYHRRSMTGPLVLMVVLVSPVEVLVIELLLQALLPLLWLRVLVLLLGVYFVFWILGFYASRIVLPHRFEEAGLRLYHGIFAEGFIPYEEIRNSEKGRRKAPEWGDGLQIDGDEAFLAVGGKTDVSLELGSPRSLNGFFRTTGPVGTLHLGVDDPEGFARELEHRLRSLSSGENRPLGCEPADGRRS